MKPDEALTPTESRGTLARTLGAFLLLATSYTVLISWLDPALPWPLNFSSVEPWQRALLNVFPVLLLNSLLLIVTRRIVLASWLTLLTLLALYAINRAKLQELATPLPPDDFHFLRTLGVSYSFFPAHVHTVPAGAATGADQ